MSPDPRRQSTPRQTLRARLLMAGGFAGAILALSLSVAFSWTDAAEGGTGGGRGHLSKEARAAFASPPGTCLSWKQPDASDAHVVPCTDPHLFEVSSLVDLSAGHPDGSPEPTLDQWRQVSQSRCSDDAQAYLGKPLDPYGRLTIGLLRPTTDQWSDGDRQVRCGLQWSGPGGGLQPTSGQAKTQNQSYVWDPGTCLALVGKTVGDPVDCAQVHSYEIVATLDLEKQFPNGYPSQTDQKAWLDTACAKALQDYAGLPDLSSKGLILAWDTREQESWNVGSTLVNCKVAAKLPDGSGLQSVQGSIRTVSNQSSDGDGPASPTSGGTPAPPANPPAGGGN